MKSNFYNYLKKWFIKDHNKKYYFSNKDQKNFTLITNGKKEMMCWIYPNTEWYPCGRKNINEFAIELNCNFKECPISFLKDNGIPEYEE